MDLQNLILDKFAHTQNVYNLPLLGCLPGMMYNILTPEIYFLGVL